MRLRWLLLTIAIPLVPLAAWANQNDLHLYALGDPNPGNAACPTCKVYSTAGDTLFAQLGTEFGAAMAPRFGSPADTLGFSAFDVGVEYGFTFVNNNKDYWRASESAIRPSISNFVPPNMLQTVGLRVRKGFGFSFEMDAWTNYLINSEMFMTGVDGKWAINEGFYYLPDLAIRVSASRLFGSADLDMTIFGGDVVMSKSFGIGGQANLTPYFGFGLLWVNFASHVLVDPSNLDPTNLNHTPPDFFVWSSPAGGPVQMQRFYGGLRFVTYIAEVLFEGVYTPLPATVTPGFAGASPVPMGGAVTTFTVKLAFSH